MVLAIVIKDREGLCPNLAKRFVHAISMNIVRRTFSPLCAPHLCEFLLPESLHSYEPSKIDAIAAIFVQMHRSAYNIPALPCYYYELFIVSLKCLKRWRRTVREAASPSVESRLRYRCYVRFLWYVDRRATLLRCLL